MNNIKLSINEDEPNNESDVKNESVSNNKSFRKYNSFIEDMMSDIFGSNWRERDDWYKHE